MPALHCPAGQAILEARTGSIEWSEVKIRPTTHPVYPVEPGSSHYYAARATDASPIQAGGDNEKFLFYRGLASFSVPISARLDSLGRVIVTPTGADTVGTVILFTKEGGRIGFRVVDRLGGGGTIDIATLTGSFATLRSTLEKMLVARGLYPREAAAMVETWRDTWFEDGTRLLYFLPRSSVDARLPLEITPKPAEITRVFVGRLELITPDQVQNVATTIETNDVAALAKRGRFLEPISRRIVVDSQAGMTGKRIQDALYAAALVNAKKAPACGL